MNSFTQRDLSWINFIFFIYDLFAIHLYRIALKFAHATTERLSIGIFFFIRPTQIRINLKMEKLKMIYDRKATMKLNSMRREKPAAAATWKLLLRNCDAPHTPLVYGSPKNGEKSDSVERRRADTLRNVECNK